MSIEIEIADIDISNTGNVVPKRSDIALIDADTIVYASASVCETRDDLLSKDFYSDKEWEEIINNPYYDEEEHCIWDLDLDEAMLHAKAKIQTILDETGCTEYELHFTAGRKSFRYTKVDKDYKANRLKPGASRSPTNLIGLKKLFVAKQDNAFIWYEWEADDIVVSLKAKDPDKYLLVALDKDVIYSLPGHHFNYYSSALYNIQMKFIDVDEITALKHHYKQTLTGDAGDGIYGLKGIGPKKADKLLANCTTHQECWAVVLEAYGEAKVLKNGKEATEVDAVLNMRLVNMQQLVYKNNKWEVQLWKPKQ